MENKIGYKVKFINEDLEGKILSIISDDKLLILANDGFEYRVDLSDVIIIDEDKSITYQVPSNLNIEKISIPKTNSFKSVLSKYTTNTKYQYEKIVEIDLHLEELVEFPNRLEDWQKLHTQLQHVKKCLHAAFEERIKRIVFIHGKGTGVLRTELRNFLSNYDDIIVKEADYREYGGGATEVIIK